MTTARRVAYDVLTAVDQDDAYANLVLPQQLRSAGLSPRDAALATELSYGTLRMQGWYDAIIDQVSSRPLDRIDPAVLRLLRLGAHQLLTMRTSTHAAVSETVELSRRVGVGSAAGFINATLRRISERSDDEWRALAIESLDPDEARDTLSSHPSWIVDEFERALSRSNRGEEIDALLAADNANPAVNLVLLPGFEHAAAPGVPNRFSPFGAALERGNPALATQASGVRVQDEGSQLAALALSRVHPAEPGERWLDLCAGPGGKAALLAAEARQANAQLIANEVSPHRADLVRSALLPVDSSVEVRVADGRDYPQPNESFDRILLDAPCTGLGALRRRPEARWRKHPDDVAELADLQRQLLESALGALSEQGVLAYVTCSPVLDETTEQIQRLLDAKQARLLDTAAVLDGVALEPLQAAVHFPGTDGSAVQLWPQQHHTDAMFVALLQRA